jgi:Histidine phosphatase superfamily (branch 2)
MTMKVPSFLHPILSWLIIIPYFVSETILLVQSIPHLVQIHVITRHGSRTAVPTSSSSSQAKLGTLTAMGERQMYDVGLWLRRRYGVADTLLRTYAGHDVRIESSEFERTIASANALTLGLFPPSNRTSRKNLLPPNIYLSIPVYMKSYRDDIFLVAYDNCPQYNRNMLNFFASQDWADIEAENKDFLIKLGSMSMFQAYVNDDGYIPLNELWNVYDYFEVIKAQCIDASDTTTMEETICQSINLSEEEYITLSSLAHQAELQKYSNIAAKDWLGGNLLFRIHERMGGDVSEFSPGTSPSDTTGNRKFYHYSAHHATLLSVLAALNIPPPSNEVIPGYGAALVFELYADPATNEHFIYILYKEATQDTGMTIRFPEGPCEGQISCPLEKFTSILSSFSFSSLEEWCFVCDNESADICLGVKFLSQFDTFNFSPAPTTIIQPRPSPPHYLLQPESSTPPTSSSLNSLEGCDKLNSSSRASTSPWSSVQAFLGGIVIGALIMAFYSKWLRGRSRKVDEIENMDPDNIIDRDYSDRIT